MLSPSTENSNMHLYMKLYEYMFNCILFCIISCFMGGMAIFKKYAFILALYIFICFLKFEIMLTLDWFLYLLVLIFHVQITLLEFYCLMSLINSFVDL